jgi:hypothetical protein
MPSLEINLDLGATVQQPFAPSNVGSAPNRDKDRYLMDDIKDPTPCTLMYVKGRTSRTINVVEATMMPSHIHHVQPAPADYAVVKVTTIREGREFEDLDYPDEDEGIEKLVDAEGTFILWPYKDIIAKTHSSPIVSPWSIEDGGTPTSNMPKPAQISHPSVTPPLGQDPAKESQVPELQDNREHSPPSPAQDPELQESTRRRVPSPVKESQSPKLQGNTKRTTPPAQDQEFQGNKEDMTPSPPSQVLELQDTTRKMPPPPPIKDLHLHPSTKQPELPPSTDRDPPTQQPVYEIAKDSSV